MIGQDHLAGAIGVRLHSFGGVGNLLESARQVLLSGCYGLEA
jgi:hypothetical protein